ncbi:MAG: metal ABC transporter ATP-binding protein [Candidatus Muiribacteriota bacterium]
MELKTIVKINNLNFKYEYENVLENINLEIKEKDFLALIGPNGGGKSTLIKLILGLLKPSSGSVELFGKKPSVTRFKAGYVPQQQPEDYNFPVTVKEIIEMGFLGLKGRNCQKFKELVKELELTSLINKKIGRLSGGQKQRVFIARALIAEPELLILDEPVSGIDNEGQKKIFRILKSLNKKITILMVSHDLNVLINQTNSVACVNKTICYHNFPEITNEMKDLFYGCQAEIIEKIR